MNFVNRMILTQMKRLLSHGWMISLLIVSQHLFKVSTLRWHTITKTATPLVNCIVNDGLVDAVPNVHQTLVEFVNIVHPWLIHSLLDDWIEVWTVWRPQIRWNESRCCSLEKSHSVTCLVCRSAALLKDEELGWHVSIIGNSCCDRSTSL